MTPRHEETPGSGNGKLLRYWPIVTFVAMLALGAGGLFVRAEVSKEVSAVGTKVAVVESTVNDHKTQQQRQEDQLNDRLDRLERKLDEALRELRK